jgi:hypothetical protein
LVVQEFFLSQIQHFQTTFFPNLELKYQDFLRKLLDGKPMRALLGVFGLLIASFVIMGIAFGTKWTKVLFFPDTMPADVCLYGFSTRNRHW